MESNLINREYKNWLSQLKSQFRDTQLKAVVTVNSALLEFYWQLGTEITEITEITEKQKSSIWGDGFLKQLSQDLIAEFPGVKGFSLNNLQYIKRWDLFYINDNNCGTACSTISQQIVARVFKQLNLVEQWGSGIARIEQYCRDANVTLPKLTESGDFIDWEFPRANKENNLETNDVINDVINDGINIPKNIQLLLQAIQQTPQASIPTLAKQLDVGTATVERHIKWLKEHRIIKRSGAKKDGIWQVLNEK